VKCRQFSEEKKKKIIPSNRLKKIIRPNPTCVIKVARRNTYASKKWATLRFCVKKGPVFRKRVSLDQSIHKQKYAMR